MSLGFETYVSTVQGVEFEIPHKYGLGSLIGQFATCVLCSAEDRERNEWVAIRKAEAIFDNLQVARRLLREVRIMKQLDHDNLTNIVTIFAVENAENFDDVYLVIDLGPSDWTDLLSIIKSPQVLSTDHIRFFLYQILRGMKYVHSASVIHRDLKPKNILVNSSCDLKIADFSQARLAHQDKSWTSPMTEYVCTRWYRAPEVLCSWSSYTPVIDVWSIGCIFAEMLERKPLLPGRNTQEQLRLIVSLLGAPDEAGLKAIASEKARRFIETMKDVVHQDLSVHLKNVTDPEMLDLTAKMLTFAPTERVSIEIAIAHPFFAQLHCPEDEPTREPIESWEFEFERRRVDMDLLRRELFREVLNYYPEKQEELLPTIAGPEVDSYRILAPGEQPFEGDDEGGVLNLSPN